MSNTFETALNKVAGYAKGTGFVVTFTKDLDEFFKGDLDGQEIWIDSRLEEEEKLFNLLHLIGHSIQWNTDQNLYLLGSRSYRDPDEGTIFKLYRYEWEANCYGLYILEYLGFKSLKTWLYDKFKEDINYLMEYYRTGKKEKILPDERIPSVELVPLAPPDFVPIARKHTRDRGVVISW